MRYRFVGPEAVTLHQAGFSLCVRPGEVVELRSPPDLPEWIALPTRPPSRVGEPRQWWGEGWKTYAPWALFYFGRRFVPWPVFVRPVEILPTSDAPRGRYGETILEIFAETPNAPGIVVVEQDIAAGPEAVSAMDQAIAGDPDSLWALPYRLYPTSTSRTGAIWAHRGGLPQSWEVVSATERCPSELMAFGLGCTYLPRVLLDYMHQHLDAWDYPLLDTTLSRVAHELGVSMRSVDHHEAVHMHWGGERDAGQ